VERNRYLDLLRPLAIGCVVYGHWMLIGLTYYRGQFSDLNVLDYIEWGRWVTWEFQVMPTSSSSSSSSSSAGMPTPCP